MQKTTIILLLVFIFLCRSCENLHSKKVNGDIEDTVINWFEKEIKLPDSLYLFDMGKKEKINTNDYFGDGVKILSIINKDCLNCTISELLFWDGFKKNYENCDGVQFAIFYCGINDYFCNVLMEDIGIQLPVLLDEMDFISKNNELFENAKYSTVLLSSENRVILIGDFTNNEKLEDLYIAEIDNQLQ